MGTDAGARRPAAAGFSFSGLPPRPEPQLDHLLDAVERCLTRYGLRRTTMSDIARELGVARTTLYRQVGSIEEATALMSSRRLHRFVDKLLDLSEHEQLDADALVHAIVRAIRMTLAEPVVQRLLHDEPDLLGEMLTTGAVARLVEQITGVLTPVLRQGMRAGVVRMGDPAHAAAWVVRVVLVLTAVPAADDDLEASVRYVLVPLLDPGA